MLATALVCLFSIFFLDRAENSLRLNYDRKVTAITKVFQHFGYGGAIHAFKNYILRGKEDDFVKARSEIAKVLAMIKELKDDPDFEIDDAKALDRIEGVVKEYRTNLLRMRVDIEAGESLGVNLDRKYKIDDEKALDGIELILQSLQQEKINFERNLTLLRVLVYLILFVFFLVNFLAYRREIMNLSAVNASLASANEELLQFSYRTSHDLKAPLVAIKELSDFVLEDIDEGEVQEATSNVKRIQTLAENLKNLVTNLLTVAKSDLSDDHQLEKVNLKELLSKLKNVHSHIASGRGVALNSEVNLTRDHFSSEPRLFHILSNLILNGITYSNPEVSNSFVTVRVHDTVSNLILEVEDNGLGIQTDNKNEIFEMFKRLRSSNGAGSGLGLYMVKKSTTKMSGEIDYESTSAGTKFTVRIPSRKGS